PSTSSGSFASSSRYWAQKRVRFIVPPPWVREKSSSHGARGGLRPRYGVQHPSDRPPGHYSRGEKRAATRSTAITLDSYRRDRLRRRVPPRSLIASGRKESEEFLRLTDQEATGMIQVQDEDRRPAISAQDIIKESDPEHGGPARRRARSSHSARPKIPVPPVLPSSNIHCCSCPSDPAAGGPSWVESGDRRALRSSFAGPRPLLTSRYPPGFPGTRRYGRLGYPHHTNSDSTKVSASNGWRSSRASPTPMNLTGRLMVWRTATTTPPLAVPSSLVRIRPVQPMLLVKTSAWGMAFWPLVASMTRRTSWGAPGIIRWSTPRIFSSSRIRWVWVCSRPAVSTIRTSTLRASARWQASCATLAGSA